MAASRGGRRSTLVELHPRLRFAAVDLGASSIDVEVINGRLEPVAAYREAADIRSGPEGDPAPGQRAARQGQGRRRLRAARRGRHRRAGAGQLPRRRAGLAADHAGLGPLPGARAARPRARLPGGGGQRRQHHGDRRAARRGRPLGRRLPLRQDRHRHRLRHPPRPARSTGASTAAPATSGTSRSTRTGRCAPAATSAAWRRCSAAPRWPATRSPRPAAATSPALAERLAANGAVDRPRRRRGRRRGRRRPASG